MSSPNMAPKILGLRITGLTLSEAAELLVNDCIEGAVLKYAVTPNIDHVVNLHGDAEFADAYDAADYTFADGWPVVAALRGLGVHVPARVAGSDLVPEVLEHANRHRMPVSVFVLGGMGDVSQRAADAISCRFPNLRVAGHFGPALGFDRDAGESTRICRMITDSNANLVILGLGAPKQEKWVHRYQGKLGTGVVICAGATVDFLAGAKIRAPSWISRCGLEWAFRLLQEPGRLGRRYLRAALLFPVLVVKQARALRRHRRT